MRRVILKIKSAKIVNTKYKADMSTVGRVKTGPTQIINDMDNLIHFNHISNALHVMLGDRPVSSRYPNERKRSDYIDNIIKSGLLRYDNITKYDYTTKSGDVICRYVNEYTQGNKPFFNSNRKGMVARASNGEVALSYLTWSKIKEKSMFSPQYSDVINVMNEFSKHIGCDIKQEYSFIDALVLMRDYPEYVLMMNSIDLITPVTAFLNKTGGGSGLTNISKHNSPNRAAVLNTSAQTPKISVDATLILYMSDDDTNMLLNSKGTATILDGGYIKIMSHDTNDVLDDTFPNTVQDFAYVSDDDVDDDIDYYIDNKYIKIKDLSHTLPYEENQN